MRVDSSKPLAQVQATKEIRVDISPDLALTSLQSDDHQNEPDCEDWMVQHDKEYIIALGPGMLFCDFYNSNNNNFLTTSFYLHN